MLPRPRALLRAFFGFVLLAPIAGCVGAPDHTDVGAQLEALHAVCATSSAATLGFDVSKWQGTIDWTKVGASGKAFVFVRSTSGGSYVDPRFGANWSGAKAAGLLRGAYHYFDVSVDGPLQADLMLATIGALEPDDLPPVVDVEDAMGETADTIVARLAAFRDRVRAKLGREPMIYSGGHFWDTYVGATEFAATPFWTAHWFTDGTTSHCPNTPDAWAHWTMWQYSNTGAVPGVSGDVDLDVFDGTRADLVAFAHASVIGGATDGLDAGEADGSVESDASVDGGLAGADAGDASAPAHIHPAHGCAVLGTDVNASREGSTCRVVLAFVLLLLVARRRARRTERTTGRAARSDMRRPYRDT